MEEHLTVEYYILCRHQIVAGSSPADEILFCWLYQRTKNGLVILKKYDVYYGHGPVPVSVPATPQICGTTLIGVGL